jgi:phosphoglycolate phosphatase
MPLKDTLVVLDFDGLLINSYELLKMTFNSCGLDVGDEARFQNRRKFLKYVGGGKEVLGNLVNLTLPKKTMIREQLTKTYCNEGEIYPEFKIMINDMIDSPNIHVGIVSRNFTHHPGKTIRKVLRNSKINEGAIDFIIPISAGVKKVNVLEGMKSSSYKNCIFAADEIGDYKAAKETGYNKIFMASYGFDTKERLIKKGEIPEELIYDTPKKLQKKLQKTLLKLH